MDFKRTSLSFLCASLIFTCAAFTNHSPTLSKSNRKDKKKAHTLIISPTALNAVSTTCSVSFGSSPSLTCFQTPLDFLPIITVVAKDTLAEQETIEITATATTNQQDEQADILALLDEEANQKTTQKDIELDEEEIEFSSNTLITPQLIQKVATRNYFVTSLVDIAIAQEGTPYVHGGKSPRGFDCSGFVSYVYSQFNVNLPASSSSYDNVGKKVRLEDAQVGDVICFTGRNSRSGRTGHVGIVVENNPNEPIKFIHAASGSRRRVTFSTMDSGYYKARFRSVRRISAPILETETTDSAE